MRELMEYLSNKDNGKPLICLIGLEKSGSFVEHAALIEPALKSGHYLLPDTEYIYKYIQPGNPSREGFGHNTYYGAKLYSRVIEGMSSLPRSQPDHFRPHRSLKTCSMVPKLSA